MSVTYTRHDGQAAAAAAAIYTADASLEFAVIEAATVTNSDTVTRTITMHFVNSGGSADATNIIVDGQSLVADASAVLDELIGHVMAPGDSVQTLSDLADKVNVQISVREVT